MFNISVKEPGYEPLLINVYDLNGKLVRNMVFHTNGSSLVESIDMSELPNGVYTARIINREGTVVKKIIKN